MHNVLTAQGLSIWLPCRAMPTCNIMEEAFELDEAEYMRLMAEMEQSFLDEQLRDEAAFLLQLEAEDAQDLHSLVTF